jgi:hypothetical protein
MRPKFHDVEELWERDGSLRDIFVQNMKQQHWDRFDLLLQQYQCTYRFDGVSLPFPGSRSVLANRDGSHVLSIALDGPVINCHFFYDQPLELDASPEEVTGPFEHDQVLAFVERLGNTLKLPVDLTPENCRHDPFLTYVPGARIWLAPE